MVKKNVNSVFPDNFNIFVKMKNYRNMKISDKPFINAGYVGAITIIFVIVLQLTFILTAGEPSSAILELEFAKLPSDVLNIFFDSGYKHNIINAVNYANIVDFLFMSSYSVFLLILIFNFYKLTRSKIFMYALVIPVIAFIADILENMQMYYITGQLVSETFADNLPYLHFFTYLKWLSLSGAFLVVAWFHFRQRILINYILGGISVVPFILGIIALFSKNLQLEIIFAFSIFLIFGISIIYTFIFKYQPANE